MIDYEKLVQAHELCKKIDEHFIEVTLGCDDIHVNLYYEQGNMYLGVDTIDECIKKLQELTQPQPKYKVREEVWMLFNNEPRCFTVYNYQEHGYVLNGLPIGYVKESQLFPTKLDLIKFQANYWNKLWEESRITFDCPSQYSTGYMDPFDMPVKQCQHERDPNEPPIPAESLGMHITEWAYKCKLCGEFYK